MVIASVTRSGWQTRGRRNGKVRIIVGVVMNIRGKVNSSCLNVQSNLVYLLFIEL